MEDDSSEAILSCQQRRTPTLTHFSDIRIWLDVKHCWFQGANPIPRHRQVSCWITSCNTTDGGCHPGDWHLRYSGRSTYRGTQIPLVRTRSTDIDHAMPVCLHWMQLSVLFCRDWEDWFLKVFFEKASIIVGEQSGPPSFMTYLKKDSWHS